MPPQTPAAPNRPGFTLQELAVALRGMPREARMLVRLPDGALRDIAFVTPTTVADDAGGPATAIGGTYSIVLVVE